MAVYAAAVGMTVCIGLAGRAAADDFDIDVPGLDPIIAPAAEGATLFRNVRVFDGNSPELSAPSNVLVRGNKIERITTDEIEAAGARTITGDGRVLMPGLIDAHWHAIMAATPQPVMMAAVCCAWLRDPTSSDTSGGSISSSSKKICDNPAS